jgi:putative membrane protein
MMWGNGFTMGWGWFFGALVLIGVILVVFVVVRLLAGGSRQGTTMVRSRPQRVAGAEKTPRQILDERYAKGELSTEEYQERLRVLGSDS